MFPTSDDPLAEVLSAPRAEAKKPPASYTGGKPAQVFKERCGRCFGNGRFGRAGVCFKCRGAGTIERKTSPETRAKARAAKAAKVQRTAAENLEAFKAAEPAVFAWFDGNAFPFAVAMRDAVAQWGGLTERQLAASKSAMEKLAAAKAQRAERIEQAPAVNTDALTAAFNKALEARGKRAPALLIAGLRIYPAKATSANAGALYVRDRGADLYLGKIVAGKFMASRDCSDEARAKVLEAITDPKGAAIRSGIATMTCAVCARELTRADSIAAGIGPDCAAKMGW